MSDEDREVLVRWSRRPTTQHSITQRARTMLLAADGLSNIEATDKVGVNQATGVTWRKRFIERGLDGLADDPRPGAPRSIGDDDVEAAIVRTLALEGKPTDATHWSTLDLAAKSGISASAPDAWVFTAERGGPAREADLGTGSERHRQLAPT